MLNVGQTFINNDMEMCNNKTTASNILFTTGWGLGMGHFLWIYHCLKENYTAQKVHQLSNSISGISKKDRF